MATQVTLGSGVVDSAAGLKLRTNGSTEAVDISTAQVVTLAKDAVVNGLTVGKGAGAISTNTAVGASALAANTTGLANSAFGSGAGYSIQDGIRNTFIGRDSGRLTVSGSHNTGIGESSLYNNTGSYNTGLGKEALAANTTASYNTAVGYQSGYSNTTGQTTTALGYKALYSNTTSDGNTAVGYQAGLNTTGASNTALGSLALFNNTTSSNNTAVGYQAGYTNSTGASNTFIGYQAGYSSVGGGTGAGSGSNSCFGNASGYGLTSGVFNTFAGQSSGYYVTTGSKNTILGSYNGNQGGLDIRTANNYIVLSDGDGNPRQFINSNGAAAFSNYGTFYNTTATSFQVNTNANDDVIHGVNANASPYGVLVRFTGADPNNASNYVFGAYTTTSSTWMYRIWSNGTVSARSDERFKKNIEPARDGYLEDLNKIGIVKYNWYNSEEGAPKELGWIAQQIETVFPGLVQTDVAEDGTESKSVKLSVFTPMLIKALQELNAKVEAQAAEIAALKGQA